MRQTLAIFETSAHPEHTPFRACSALVFLDDIIHALALTTIDARDPDASIFMPRMVPSVAKTYQSAGDSRCRCGPPMHLPSLLGREHQQISLPEWDPNWSVEEIRLEETRRLCWSALTLAATHTTHCMAFQTQPLDLFVTKPENVRIEKLKIVHTYIRSSMPCCSPESMLADRKTPSSPPKNLFGPYIAAVCCSGTGACSSGMR